MQATYNDLPPELLDPIFRHACTLSIPFCLALSQTSFWTREIALPYLYSAIVLKTKDMQTTKSIQRNALVIPNNILISSKDFLHGNHVRGLWIENANEISPHILHSFNHLSRLALREGDICLISLLYNFLVSFSKSANSILYPAFLDRPDSHLLVFKAKNLNLTIPSLPPQTTIAAFFRKITHLRFGQVESYSTCWDLAYLSRLSHIAIPYYHPQQQFLPDLLSVFDQSSKISLVVVLLVDKLSEEERRDALTWVADMRKSNRRVSAVLSKLDDLQMEWEEEVRYGQSIWDKADLFTQSLSSHLS